MGLSNNTKHSKLYDNLEFHLGRNIDFVWFLVGKNRTNEYEMMKNSGFKEVQFFALYYKLVLELSRIISKSMYFRDF